MPENRDSQLNAFGNNNLFSFVSSVESHSQSTTRSFERCHFFVLFHFVRAHTHRHTQAKRRRFFNEIVRETRKKTVRCLSTFLLRFIHSHISALVAVAVFFIWKPFPSETNWIERSEQKIDFPVASVQLRPHMHVFVSTHILRFATSTVPLMIINNRYQLSISNQFNASLKCNRSATIFICYSHTSLSADWHRRVAAAVRVWQMITHLCDLFFAFRRGNESIPNQKATHFVTSTPNVDFRRDLIIRFDANDDSHEEKIITHRYIQIWLSDEPSA